VLCTRWTMLVVRELIAGSMRFNDLRRGLPRMSPALLSKRLRELERLGVVERANDPQSGVAAYRLTAAGQDLKPVVMSVGIWGQRWLESQLSLKNLDPSLLMWDMRRSLNPRPLPPRKVAIQFLYPELADARQRYWLVVDGGEVDLCSVDPGLDIDLYVVCDLRTMTAIWMGVTSVREAVDSGALQLSGDQALAERMQQWLGLSPFAVERKRVPA
jgi:DNA-binding HxlR family transcriptional regulator